MVSLTCDAIAGREHATGMRADARRLLKLLRLGHAELSIVLTDDCSIRFLNRDFRGKDKATDVLSFPQLEDYAEAGAVDLAAELKRPLHVYCGNRPTDEQLGRTSLTSREESRRPPERDYQAADRLTVPPLLLGDIVISIDTAQRQAFRLKQTCASRLRTLLIHGLLHLHGYDHERSPREARRMFARERELTAELEGVSNRKIAPSRARGSKARSGGRSA